MAGGGPLGDAKQIVEGADTGARLPVGNQARLLFAIAFAWSLFQLWYASPLSFAFDFLNLNFTESRSVHLAFAVMLAFLAFPARAASPHHRVPVTDWVMGTLAAMAAAYICIFQGDLAARSPARVRDPVR